jgi:hypothetical protein
LFYLKANDQYRSIACSSSSSVLVPIALHVCFNIDLPDYFPFFIS